jgi:predicted Holliday junction resolvase-like endonuclease
MSDLDRWKVSVERIEEKWYTYSDVMDDELYIDIAMRKNINERQLTKVERKKLEELDNRFRQALYDCLKKAEAVEWYKKHGAEQPMSDWWWHVEEV